MIAVFNVRHMVLYVNWTGVDAFTGLLGMPCVGPPPPLVEAVYIDRKHSTSCPSNVRSRLLT